VDRLLELDMRIEAAAPAPTDPGELVEALVGVGVSMATGQRHRTLARYELSLAAAREPQLRAALVRGGDAIREVVAQALRGAGALDARTAADELAATLDGMVLTALVRGPHEPGELARWLRPALARALDAHLARAGAQECATSSDIHDSQPPRGGAWSEGRSPGRSRRW
jgi:hypothetical protein